jgi:hypothetical protein
MQLEIKLDLGDGPFTVRTTLYCWVLWERKTKQKIGDLAAGPGFDDLAYLAYEACKQQKIVVPAVYDDFVKKIIDLGLEDTDADRPTEAAPTGDS